ITCLSAEEQQQYCSEPDVRRLIESGRLKIFTSVANLDFPEYDGFLRFSSCSNIFKKEASRRCKSAHRVRSASQVYWRQRHFNLKPLRRITPTFPNTSKITPGTSVLKRWRGST